MLKIIGIDASRALRENKTGVEFYAYNIIEQIVKTGPENVQFVLYCPFFRSSAEYGIKKTDDKQPNQWLLNLSRRGNVKIKHLRWPFRFLWTQGRLSLEMLFHAPDVLFIPASAMPLIHPKNTITTVHDLGFKRYPEAYGKWPRIYLNWSTKFAVKFAKRIITISDFSKKEIIKYYGIDEEKIAVTHLGYDNGRFRLVDDQKKTQDVLAKYKISRPYILFVGRLEKKKNIVNLIKAFALLKCRDGLQCVSTLKSITLVLAGLPGYGWVEAENIICENNLQNSVITAGYIPDEDLPYLYSGAALFLFPSLYEGFGLPVLEAMACGVPVIASNAASGHEVGKEAAIYVNPDNYQEIAAVSEKFLLDENLRQSAIKKGLEISAKFSWEKCGRETNLILGV